MRIHGLLWLGALALAVAGCGGGGPECGAGTVEEDGECVPESTTMCGPGTVDDGTGNCVLEMESSTCGAGTSLNPATGECVADVECGTGTVAMGGACVPDGSVICADGTIFDDTTGTCLTDGRGACAEGTTLIDGECVLDDDTLVAEVAAAAEQDDPINFEGTPATFTVPEIGAERTLDGCITPVDIDGDGETDVDLDFFAFTVSEPGLYRINADGLGGLAAGFAVEPQEGTLDDQNWIRLGVNYAGDTSERRVYIPAPGDYYLYLFDSRSFDPFSGTFSQPVGSAETCYYVTIEAEALPTPTALPSSLTATGLIGDPLFYSATASGDTIFRSVLEVDSGGLIPSQVIANGADVGSGIDEVVSTLVVDGSDVLVVVDHIFSITMDPAPFDLTLSTIQQLPADGTITLTYDADGPNTLAFQAGEGDVVHLEVEVSSVPPLTRRVSDATTGFTYCTSCGADIYFVAASSGTQLVELTSGSAATGETFEVTSRVTVTTPEVATPGAPVAVALSADERTFVRADLSANVWTRADLSGFMGATFTTADVGLFIDEPGLLGVPDDDVGLVSVGFGRIHGPSFGQSVLIEIADPVSVQGDEQLTITVDEETFEDISPTPGTDFTQAGVTVPAGEPVYYFVRGLTYGVLTFTVTPDVDTDVVIDVLDNEVRSTTVVDLDGAGGAETYSVEVDEQGWVALAVTAATAGTMDVLIRQEAPPYTVSAGTRRFASVCPSAGGTGMAITFTDDGNELGADDEGLYGAALPASFELFGETVSGYVLSTNGWITFDETYAGDALYTPEPLETAEEPNSLVAPLWQDYVNVEACLLEAADRVVFEWNGDGLIYFLGDYYLFGVAQMQLVVDLTTGTMEFVYGPNHDVGRTQLDGVIGTMGLENADGSEGIGTAGLEPVGGTSIVFTPAP